MLTNTGAHGCDINDDTLRVQEGHIITKEKFPIATINMISIKDTDYLSVTLGPLKCWGGK